MGKFKDLTGQKFGRLTVIEQASVNTRREILWLCKCDCGKKCVTSGHDLKNGHTKSCGCLHKERVRETHFKPLEIGRRFGRLVVLNYSHSIKRKSYYTCRCDCGNVITVQSNSLLSGKQKSCQCSSLISSLSCNVRANNKTGYNGVSYNKKIGKYTAWLNVNRRSYYLGLWDTAEQAHNARMIAEEKLVLPFKEKYYSQQETISDDEIKKGIESIKEYYRGGGLLAQTV